MTKKNLSEKLTQLRNKMQTVDADYYYVPSSDAHQSEYVPDCWARRPYISHFTGSAGDALIGRERAYLWTDPRYFLQAELELDSTHYQLMKQRQGVAPIDGWIQLEKKPIRLAVDPKVISISQAEKLQHAVSHVGGELLSVEENWIDQIWQGRPDFPHSKISIYEDHYAGETVREKLVHLREKLKAVGADAIVVSALDSVAWLYNVRGQDVSYNPLVVSYAVVTQHEAWWFVDPERLTDAVRQHCSAAEVGIKSYEQIKFYLQNLTGVVWVDEKECSWWIEQQLVNAELYHAASPILLMKAVKNKVEQAGMREAHRMDAVAVVRFLSWLKSNWKSGVTELSASDRLEAFRRENAACRDLSFPTISGFAAHGAIIHYRSTEETNCKIDDSSLYLVDSGGQYFEGTTDITRTIHLGTPTAEQKKHYTLVLKGHLALRHAIFPSGTCGEHLNVLAHLPLWKAYLDFGHGTGHGVGCYLCVHEGPQRISAGASQIALKPGMVVSNEPGLYIENQYGIRIENLCVVVELADASKSITGDGPFYGFEDLTLVPYCRELIDLSLLSAEEIQWVNEYHADIFKKLQDSLDGDALAWLKEATESL